MSHITSCNKVKNEVIFYQLLIFGCVNLSIRRRSSIMQYSRRFLYFPQRSKLSLRACKLGGSRINMGKDIYIVLTNTGTVLANVISYCTKEHLSHVSISFDEELTEIYSFGRKHQRNPFIGGFIQEDVNGPLFRQSQCAIYRLQVNETEYIKIRNQIQHFEQYADRYRYNFLGMIAVYFNFHWDRENHYFCSQFVSTILKDASVELFHKETTLVTPADFHYAQLELVYRGHLRSYLGTFHYELDDQFQTSYKLAQKL